MSGNWRRYVFGSPYFRNPDLGRAALSTESRALLNARPTMLAAVLHAIQGTAGQSGRQGQLSGGYLNTGSNRNS